MKKKEFIRYSIYLFLLVFCTCFCKNQYFSVLSIIVFIFFIFDLFISKPKILVKFPYFIYISFSIILSLWMIEINNEYLSELREYGRFTGSIPLFVLSQFIIYIVLVVYDKKYDKNTVNILEAKKFFKINEKKLVALTSVVFIIYIVNFIFILPYPAFLYGIDRASYRMNFLYSSILTKLMDNALVMCVFPLGLAIVSCGYKKLLAIFTIVLCVLNFLWMGHKFGGFFLLLNLFLIVYSSNIFNIYSNKQLRIKLFLLGVVSLILIAMALSMKSSSGYDSVSEYVIYRFSAQGELWWKIFDLYDGVPNMKDFINEVYGLLFGSEVISDNVGANYSIYRIMYLCAPAGVVNNVLSLGYRYSEAGYASMYSYFGYMGPIIYSIINASFISKLSNKIVLSLNKNRMIEVLIYSRFFINSFGCFTNFSFMFFLNKLSILSYVYLAYTWFNKLYIKRNSRFVRG